MLVVASHDVAGIERCGARKTNLVRGWCRPKVTWLPQKKGSRSRSTWVHESCCGCVMWRIWPTSRVTEQISCTQLHFTSGFQWHVKVTKAACLTAFSLWVYVWKPSLCESLGEGNPARRPWWNYQALRPFHYLAQVLWWRCGWRRHVKMNENGRKIRCISGQVGISGNTMFKQWSRPSIHLTLHCELLNPEIFRWPGKEGPNFQSIIASWTCLEALFGMAVYGLSWFRNDLAPQIFACKTVWWRWAFLLKTWHMIMAHTVIRCL